MQPFARFFQIESASGFLLLACTAVALLLANSPQYSVRPTVAGVLLGFLTPSRAWVGTPGFPNVLTNVLERLVKSSDQSAQRQRQQASGFIAGLALQGKLLDEGKVGILAGSAISALLGCSLLLMFIPKKAEAPVGVHQQQAGRKEMPEMQLFEENDQPAARGSLA